MQWTFTTKAQGVKKTVIQKEKAQFKLKPNMKVEGFWHEKARVFAEQLLCNYPPAGLAICGLNLATAQSQRYEHRPQRGAGASRPLLSVESQSDPGCDEKHQFQNTPNPR